MGGGTADEILSPGPIIDHRRLELASLPIPDELLAEIFLRLPTPADLARASAGCVSFRRLTADRSFLRRYRKIHPPPLLGFLNTRKVFYPATSPYPSASAASAVALAADFSFSFLPAPTSDWVVQDIRDGRVLLDRRMLVRNSSTVVFKEVVVCDPLQRRYLLLPPISCDVAASVEDPILPKQSRLRVEIFLAPAGHGEEAATADEASFKVIWMAQCKNRVGAFVFSSCTGQWRAVLSRRWTDLSTGLPPLTAKSLFHWRHYVYGCFYWLTADCEESKLLVLDTKAKEFSIAEPPPEAHSCYKFAMVEAGEGRPGMFLLASSRSDISYFIRQNDGGSSSLWQNVKTISLGSRARLIYNMEKHLLLHKEQSSLLEAGCFTLDIETFQLERVCALDSTFHKLHAYSNFPPSLLSSPTISSGVEKGPEKEMLDLEQGCAPSSSAESARSE